MENCPIRSEIPTPGTVFHGRYQVEHCLRSGGMGAVCEIIDRNTARRRALKTMLPHCVSDPGLRARFKHEATITAQVDSEHLVEIFDAGIDEETGMPFIVMELLKGEDLGELLAHCKRLPPADVVLLLHQASHALDRTHALSIVHRDLKPENLYLTRRADGSPRLKILDFGVAKLLTESTRWATTAVLGSPLYMAPEQAVGEAGIGPAADIYALGHIAFTLLVGEAFWEETARCVASPVVLLAKVALGSAQTATQRASALGVSLPSGIDAWFAKATARVPRERFETASELVEALSEVLAVLLPSGAGRGLATSDAIARGAPPPLGPAHGTCAAVSKDLSSPAPKRAAVPIVIALAALAAATIVGMLAGTRLLSRSPAAVSVEVSAEVPALASSTPRMEPRPASPTESLSSSPAVVLKVSSSEPAGSTGAGPPNAPLRPRGRSTVGASASAPPPPERSGAGEPSVPGKEPEPSTSRSRVQDPSNVY
jgi:eukaryotic-like serine/threonine-protein kinase